MKTWCDARINLNAWEETLRGLQEVFWGIKLTNRLAATIAWGKVSFLLENVLCRGARVDLAL